MAIHTILDYQPFAPHEQISHSSFCNHLRQSHFQDIVISKGLRRLLTLSLDLWDATICVAWGKALKKTSIVCTFSNNRLLFIIGKNRAWSLESKQKRPLAMRK